MVILGRQALGRTESCGYFRFADIRACSVNDHKRVYRA